VIAYLDCFSGISGDKTLSALIDAGADEGAIRTALETLDVSGWDLRIFADLRGGLACTRIEVTASGDQPHRTWLQIRDLLEKADLPVEVASTAISVFSELAQAEAKAHGVPLDEVHFHEVGAIDSIVDVVGVAAALHSLSVDEIVCSPISVGSGTVETAHGVLPVPAPATAILLEGAQIVPGQSTGELTTPTGAAFIRTLCTSFGTVPAMTVTACGHGGGSRELPIPNILRVILGERSAKAPTERVTVLETAVDHLSAEQIAFAVDEVREHGALDAWLSPIVMKKGRLGTSVTVLCELTDADRLAALIMSETGTLGIRRSIMERYVADRRVETIETPFGEVRFKIGMLDGEETLRPEFDDCARIARKQGIPLREVVRIVTQEVVGGS